MSSATTKKVYIQVETAAEQQENLKNQRKTFKVLQGVATDKENLTGRTQLDKLSRLKAAAVNETTLSTNNIEYAKRKKIETKVAETQTSPDAKSSNVKKIAVEDLCSEDNPGEHYWERLAEKRRGALEQSLEENQRLYERIEGLEEELNTSRQQLEEAKHLVSVLSEMLSENDDDEDAGEKGATDGEDVTPLAAEDSASNAEETDDSNSSKFDKQN